MNEDPNRTQRFVRSGKSTLKYGIQAYGPDPNPAGRPLLFLWIAVGALVLLGALIWWFGFRSEPAKSPPPAESAAVEPAPPPSPPPPLPATRPPRSRRD